MNNERTLYISPDEDLPSICTRLEHTHSRRVILIMPIQAQHFHAFGTWRMLHAYTRRRGIRVHIVSTNAYFRSVARSARFTVSKTSDAPQQEKLRRPRRSTYRPSSAQPVGSMNVGEGMNIVFLADNENSDRAAQQIPQVQSLYTSSTFMFTDDDVLVPPHPNEPPLRVSKPPQPLNMPRMRRTRPLTQPRLPWDDVDDELLPPRPLHKPIRRRTNPLVQSMMRRRETMRNIKQRSEVANIVSLSPVLCIGIFILVRSIVQYLQTKTHR